MSVCFSRGGVLAITDRLVDLAEGFGLRPGEVERLIGVHAGVWPFSPSRRAMWWPTIEQAKRIGALHGLLVNLVSVMGRDAGSAWLRARNPGLDMTPVRFMLANEQGLVALCEMLAVEQGAC